MKLNRIRHYHVSDSRPTFNQSSHVVTVETDTGITGIGEGGSRDTIEQFAGLIIGENPTRIEHLWQLMYRHYFHPPGREKIHALGAIDLALWDIKGKALGVPVYELLGGLTRDYVECYATGFPQQGTLEETARECIDFGDRAFRFHGADPDAGGAFQAGRWSTRPTISTKRFAGALGIAAIGRSTFIPVMTSPMPYGSAN